MEMDLVKDVLILDYGLPASMQYPDGQECIEVLGWQVSYEQVEDDPDEFAWFVRNQDQGIYEQLDIDSRADRWKEAAAIMGFIALRQFDQLDALTEAGII